MAPINLRINNMQERLAIPKNEKIHVPEDNLEKKLDKPEVIQLSQEELQNNDLEKISGNIELQSEKLDKNQNKLNEIASNLTPEEGEFISKQVESTEEGQNILAKIKEKTQALANAHKNIEERLSEQYNPKVVKAIGSVGKALGGFGGMLAGHGIMSAPGAVLGAKTGGYALLKGFESMVKYLPASVQEKIKKKENGRASMDSARHDSVESEKQEKINEIKEGEAAINEKLQTREKLKEELNGISGEIEALPETEKKKFMESLEGDKETVSATEGIKSVYEKYVKFYEDFEKKYPLLATGAEVAVHAAIGPIMESVDVGKQALHAIEVLAAAGGAEFLTAHLANVSNSIKESIKFTKKKIASLFQGRRVAAAVAV